MLRNWNECQYLYYTYILQLIFSNPTSTIYFFNTLTIKYDINIRMSMYLTTTSSFSFGIQWWYEKKGPEEESSPDYIISKSYFRFRCSFSKTKEEKKAAAAALKSLGRVKKKPNLSLPILLNLMCRILKSSKKYEKSGPLETLLLHTYLGTYLATMGQHFFMKEHFLFCFIRER